MKGYLKMEKTAGIRTAAILTLGCKVNQYESEALAEELRRLGIKILTLILGAFGIANMWMAIFADTGVAMLCVLNAMRLLRTGRK